MRCLQSNGKKTSDKENKMAAAKKAAVKITGTAKSTGGNMRNQAMKKASSLKKELKPLGATSDKAQLKKASMPKRPVGELPKRMSGFARVIAQDYPELGKSGAAARAGKIRGEFIKGNKMAAAKKAALAKKTK